MEETKVHEVTQSFDGSTSTRVVTSTGAESSVEIAQNSKGEPRVTVKVYHADIKIARYDAVKAYAMTIRELKTMSNSKEI